MDGPQADESIDPPSDGKSDQAGVETLSQRLAREKLELVGTVQPGAFYDNEPVQPSSPCRLKLFRLDDVVVTHLTITALGRDQTEPFSAFEAYDVTGDQFSTSRTVPKFVGGKLQHELVYTAWFDPQVNGLSLWRDFIMESSSFPWNTNHIRDTLFLALTEDRLNVTRLRYTSSYNDGAADSVVDCVF
jgi:hypothetical protein